MTTPVTQAAERRLSSFTCLGLAFAGLGIVGALASGIGLPFALAGALFSCLALRKAPKDVAWATTALVLSILATLACVILLAITASIWFGR